MLPEATIICIDNSNWMHSRDYGQEDAVNLICRAKVQSDPENTVGVVLMAGKEACVLVTLTSDLCEISESMHGLETGGEMNLAAGIQVAQSAFGHRQNEKQRQSIIIFAGSPIKHKMNTLVTIGRELKNESIALAIINFGKEDERKTEKLEALLLAAVNDNDTSYIVHVPPGPNVLSDVLRSTPIFNGGGEGRSGFAAAAGDAAKQEKGGEQISSSCDATMTGRYSAAIDEETPDWMVRVLCAIRLVYSVKKGGEQDATMTGRESGATDDETHDWMRLDEEADGRWRERLRRIRNKGEKLLQLRKSEIREVFASTDSDENDSDQDSDGNVH